MSLFLLLLISVCVLPICLTFISIKGLRFWMLSLSHFICFIIFNSNYIVLYCVILHSNILFSKLTFLLRSLPQFYF